mmetsp:Transcript_39917/g.79467  ORF Transcript_39917/g.79467 Transcript_39917/m.79467 type:complete len:224 (+) Transcript_39917:2-673(+)
MLVFMQYYIIEIRKLAKDLADTLHVPRKRRRSSLTSENGAAVDKRPSKQEPCQALPPSALHPNAAMCSAASLVTAPPVAEEKKDLGPSLVEREIREAVSEVQRVLQEEVQSMVRDLVTQSEYQVRALDELRVHLPAMASMHRVPTPLAPHPGRTPSSPSSRCCQFEDGRSAKTRIERLHSGPGEGYIDARGLASPHGVAHGRPTVGAESPWAVPPPAIPTRPA